MLVSFCDISTHCPWIFCWQEDWATNLHCQQSLWAWWQRQQTKQQGNLDRRGKSGDWKCKLTSLLLSCYAYCEKDQCHNQSCILFGEFFYWICSLLVNLLFSLSLVFFFTILRFWWYDVSTLSGTMRIIIHWSKGLLVSVLLRSYFIISSVSCQVDKEYYFLQL